jgi:hypothetical protein
MSGGENRLQTCKNELLLDVHTRKGRKDQLNGGFLVVHLPHFWASPFFLLQEKVIERSYSSLTHVAAVN